MSNSTIAGRIKNLTGSDMTTTLVSSWNDLVNAGFNAIADLIPVTSELWSTAKLSKTTTPDAPLDNKKVIMVLRKDDSSGDSERRCREISYDEYLKGQSPSSIFYLAKGRHLPAYSMGPGGKIQFAPPIDSDTVKIYYFQYITGDISGLYGFGGTEAVDGTGIGFPQEAETAGCLAASINLLQARMSFAAQDDEDLELMQLLQGQIALLDKQLQGEAQRLGLPYKILGKE